MKDILIFINLFICVGLQSQVNIDYTIESQNELNQFKLKVSITNKTDKYYVIPFDKNYLKGYYESEYCGTFDDQNYPYKFFAPTIMLKEEDNKEYLFPNSSRRHIPEGEGAENYMTDLQNIANKELKEINYWKKKNHLKSNKEALQNRYITKNLLLLKPDLADL